MNHPLETFYNSYSSLEELRSLFLTKDEIEFIALCIGFRVTQSDFQKRLLPDHLTSIEIFEIRSSIVEILRLQNERKLAVTTQKVTRVEDIYLNPGYRDSILNDLIVEVKKIARTMRLPVLDNLFVSGDDAEGYLDETEKIVMRRPKNSTFVGYSVR